MKITLYGGESCPPCATLKYYFSKNNIDYEYKDLLEHQDEASQYTNQLFPPVVVIDGQVARDIKEVARLLG